ncbi:PAS domain S-box protein [Melittangium boletus]|uniref:PAS domain S-box protein n=1 Tax=Melittangium boletus TaxID=83453 RepID=UPI003DA31032
MHVKPQPTAPPSAHAQRTAPPSADYPGEAVFQLDAQGRLTHLTPSWTELTGFPQDESLGQPGWHYVHPEDRALYETLGRRLASDARDVRQRELRYLTRDGGYRWGEVFLRPVHAPDGTYVGLLGTLHDVTERHEAQVALGRRERYLSALVDIQQRLLGVGSSPNLFERLMQPLGEASGASRVYAFEVHRSVEGDVLVSQRAEWCAPSITPQLDNPDLQGLPFENQLPRWYELMSRGQAISGLVKDFPPDERALLEPQDIRSLLALPLWVHGTLAGFIGFDNCVDERPWDKLEVDLLQAATGAISLSMEHRQAERALREREQRFRRIAENASDVLYRYQLAGTRSFAFVSGVVTKNLGFTPEEHYRDSLLWHRRVHPDDLEVLEQFLSEPQRVADTPQVVRFTKPDGRTVWLQHVVTPVLDPGGMCVAVEGIARDISERRQFEEALKLSEASFRILLEGVPEPAAIQRDGRIIYANSALSTSLGFEKAADLMGRTLQEFLLDEPPPRRTPCRWSPGSGGCAGATARCAWRSSPRCPCSSTASPPWCPSPGTSPSSASCSRA